MARLLANYSLCSTDLKSGSHRDLGSTSTKPIDTPPFTVSLTKAILAAIRSLRTIQRPYLLSTVKERNLHNQRQTCKITLFGPSWSRLTSQLAFPHEGQVDGDMNNHTIAAKTTPSPSPRPGLAAGASPTQAPTLGGGTSGTKRKRTAAVKYYAVKEGFRPGIYYNWNDCLAQVTGFKGAVCEFSYRVPLWKGHPIDLVG